MGSVALDSHISWSLSGNGGLFVESYCSSCHNFRCVVLLAITMLSVVMITASTVRLERGWGGGSGFKYFLCRYIWGSTYCVSLRLSPSSMRK